MRKSTTHVALDKKPNRFTVVKRFNSVTQAATVIHDNLRRTEHPIYLMGQTRHDAPWTGQDLDSLVNWLNERAAGYPRNPMLNHHCKMTGIAMWKPYGMSPPPKRTTITVEAPKDWFKRRHP